MAENWTTLRVLEWTTGRFAQAGFDSARLEAQVLLAHVLECDRVALYMQYDKPLGEPELAAYRALIRRRLAGEPVAYLTGRQEFWSLPFEVDQRVLIPRHDSETMIEIVRDNTQSDAALCLADICTGSGALAITLLRERANATAVATDNSDDALAVARHNAEANGVLERIELRCGDMLAALAADERFDVIVSNPPYIPSGDIDGLSAEVRHEPRAALDGGADGLDFVRTLIEGAHLHLSPGGLLAIEHGYDQAGAVRELIDATARYEPARTRDDLAGQPRITWTRRAAH